MTFILGMIVGALLFDRCGIGLMSGKAIAAAPTPALLAARVARRRKSELRWRRPRVGGQHRRQRDVQKRREQGDVCRRVESDLYQRIPPCARSQRRIEHGDFLVAADEWR
jgi:hypothetical protein